MKKFKKQINIFLIIWALFLLGIIFCLALFTANKIKNDAEYNRALIENLGKPTVIEQNYHTIK